MALIRADSALPAATPSRALLVVGCAAAFLAFLDSAVVNLAYSTIAAHFASAGTSLTWVISAYAVSFAAVLAVGGRVADTIGHRPVLLAGVAGFAVASAGCGLAPTAGVLIASRVAQGAAAGALLPAALGALLAATEAGRSARVVGAWAASGAFAAAIGPTVGAALTDMWGWRSLFMVNVPVCAVLLVVGAVVVPARSGNGRGLPDPVGVILLSGGVSCAVAVITKWHDWGGGTNAVTLAVLAAAVLALVLALWRSRIHPHPALEVRLWRSASYALSNAVNALLGFAIGAFLLAVPLFLQVEWRLTLLQASGAIGVIGVTAMLAAAAGGRRGSAATARWLCCGGLVMVTAACVVCGSSLFGSERDWLLWAVVSILLGAGVGVAVTGLSIITAATVPARSISGGLGMGLTARQTGAGFGVAVFAAILTPQRFATSCHHLFVLVSAVTAVGAVISMAMTSPPTTSPEAGDAS